MAISFVSVQWLRSFLKLPNDDVQAFWGRSGLLRGALKVSLREPLRIDSNSRRRFALVFG